MNTARKRFCLWLVFFPVYVYNHNINIRRLLYMPDREKILLMVKLALYDKRHGDADRAVFRFYRRDYIYRLNMMTRLSVAAGALILLALYWMHQILIENADFTEINYAQGAYDGAVFVLTVMAVYTVLGTMQATRRYYLCQRRMARYNAMLAQLDRLNARDAGAKPPAGLPSPILDEEEEPEPPPGESPDATLTWREARRLAGEHGLSPREKAEENTEDNIEEDTEEPHEGEVNLHYEVPADNPGNHR
jgi:hypothetical protein